jgi:hypothetical protein
MGYIVTAGAVTAETAVPGGRARIDHFRGAILPDDVPREDIQTLLARGHIVDMDAEPEGPGVDTDGDGVPEGSIAQVLDWVREVDEEVVGRATRAQTAELARGEAARKGLLAELAKLTDQA